MSDDIETPESCYGLSPHERACGNCRLFKPFMRDIDGSWTGECRLQADRGIFSASAPTCQRFMSRIAPVPAAMPPDRSDSPRRSRATAPVSAAVRVIDNTPIPEFDNMTREELKEILREALADTEVRIAPRWEGATLLIKPTNPEIQSKEIPADALFHKVVMVRDRLRVLEQKLNAHPKLSDAEKVEYQQYITRCYGSLTTFNMLFADKDDQFVGDKTKGD